jgi:hypothetical protein
MVNGYYTDTVRRDITISVTESKLSTWSIALVLRIWDAIVNNEPSQILLDPSNVALIFGGSLNTQQNHMVGLVNH